MTKRDAPESGFDPTNPSKRPLTNNHPSTSVYHQPVNSVHPNPSTNGSTAQPPPPITDPPTTADSHDSFDDNEDAFVPEPEPSQPVDNDFVLNDTQRTQLARELSTLQNPPSSAIDELFDSSITHPDSPAEHSPNDQPSSSASPNTRSRRNKFRSKRRSNHRYQPTLWYHGIPHEDATLNARKSPKLICGTTDITLDPEPLLVNGTVWSYILENEFPDLLQSDDCYFRPPAHDKFDFLKACYRLGNCIHPNRMSRLLGGYYRSPEYSDFLLQGFLGLINNPKVRALLKPRTAHVPPEVHRDVIVYANQLYPSDDEILVNQEHDSSDPEEEQLSEDAVPDVLVIEESDREEDERHRDPPQANRFAVHESKHKDPAEQVFLESMSYIGRNYMSIVTGQQITNTTDFLEYCEKVGARSHADPRQESFGRLKWLTNKMPAPELGTQRGVSEPMELWKHAAKTYSTRNLSRCALIGVNPLLDWLGYVANETEHATSEAEFYRVKRPAVAIAPLPLLYLADKAADFALRVLSVAVQTAERNATTEDEGAGHYVIDSNDIMGAARHLEDDPIHLQRISFGVDTNVFGDENTYNHKWPGLIQRPLTSSESIELCDRTPKAYISVPNSVTDEMRAVVMSFRKYVRYRVYAHSKTFTSKDPVVYMSKKEKDASRRRRKEWNRLSGIDRARKIAQEEEEDVDDGGDEDCEHAPAMETDTQTTSAPASKPSEERGTSAAPSADQVTGGNQDSIGPKADVKGVEKIPDFFDHVNVAELIAFRLGDDGIKRRKGAGQHGFEKLPIPDAALFLKECIVKKKRSISSICLYRLGWICLHALGIDVDKHPDDASPMKYASSANYTNFAQFRPDKPVMLTAEALCSLTGIADAVVRDEAEVLMACAAHDDGRPWIDKADVALVTSMRKEAFHYRDL